MANSENIMTIKKELLSSVDNISIAISKIEKVEFLLGELIVDYKFPKENEPNINKVSFDTTCEAMQEVRPTMDWVLAYNRVINFIEIAEESALNCKKLLNMLSITLTSPQL